MLDYLFEAHLQDNTIIAQTQDDVSETDPAKSAYYDVVQRFSEVEYFGLYNDTQTFVVDLRNGHFEINDIPFSVGSDDELPLGTKRELVYFRRHQYIRTQGLSEEEHTIKYHLGWKAVVDGQVVEQTLIID